MSWQDPLIWSNDQAKWKRWRRRGDGDSDLDIINEEDEDYETADQVPIEPPNPEDLNFNEHDILGEFDKDENGNIILITDKYGNLTDKQGKLVNERGYLRDKFGHIKHKYEIGWRVFSVKDLDEKGEIPLPFTISWYNFNPHEIIGHFDYDDNGQPKLLPHKGSSKGGKDKLSSSRNKQ